MGESNHVSTAKFVFTRDGSWMALTGPETSCGHIHFRSCTQKNGTMTDKSETAD